MTKKCRLSIIGTVFHLLALSVGNWVCIGVGFGHKKVWFELHPTCQWHLKCYVFYVIDGACTKEMHASGWEVLDPIREVFSLPIEPAIKKGRVISHYMMSCMFSLLSKLGFIIIGMGGRICSKSVLHFQRWARELTFFQF